MACKFDERNGAITLSSFIWNYPKNKQNSIPQNSTLIHITRLLCVNRLKYSILHAVSLISSLWTTNIAEAGHSFIKA
jgi:hypothetical protein